MLDNFLIANRSEIIRRCLLSDDGLFANAPGQEQAFAKISIFFDELVLILTNGKAVQTETSGQESEDDGEFLAAQMLASASAHGRELFHNGFTVGQVVSNYGDMCQAVTSLALERDNPITTEEFRTLNGCLDNAIAGAVIAFTNQRDLDLEATGNVAHGDVHKTRYAAMLTHVQSVQLAVEAIRTGRVGLEGATGNVLDRSIRGLHTLITAGMVEGKT